MNLFFSQETSNARPGREPERRRAILAVVLAILSAAALHAVLFYCGLYGISGDESGRTLDTIAWMRSGKPQSNVWLPLHRVLVAAGLSLYNNYFAVPRIISFILRTCITFRINSSCTRIISPAKRNGSDGFSVRCFRAARRPECCAAD